VPWRSETGTTRATCTADATGTASAARRRATCATRRSPARSRQIPACVVLRARRTKESRAADNATRRCDRRQKSRTARVSDDLDFIWLGRH
jgi:hypothetical protein